MVSLELLPRDEMRAGLGFLVEGNKGDKGEMGPTGPPGLPGEKGARGKRGKRVSTYHLTNKYLHLSSQELRAFIYPYAQDMHVTQSHIYAWRDFFIYIFGLRSLCLDLPHYHFILILI